MHTCYTGQDNSIFWLPRCCTKMHHIMYVHQHMSHTKRAVARNGHRNLIRCANFSSDAAYVATGAFDGVAKVWSVLRGECLHTFCGDLGDLKGHRLRPKPINPLSRGNLEDGEDQIIRL